MGEDNLLKYFYNGDRVSKAEFRGKVKTNLGINFNAIDAFMFSQGKLESSPFIKGGFELTSLLEELCGSADQKDKFDEIQGQTEDKEKSTVALTKQLVELKKDRRDL